MRLQSQILHTLREPEPQARLEHIVAQGTFDSRAALGREVCAQFGFVDARGRAQLAGCLKALAVLETAGQITLPQPRHHCHQPSPRCLDAPVPAPVEVPAQVRDVEGLRLVVVEDEEQRRVWNTLLATEHPHGTTTFVGCQVRYLIGSAHGWLGALGFSASALHLRGRGDAHHARARTVKSVYIYELTAHWRRHLGVARVDAAPSLSPGEGLDSAQWATELPKGSSVDRTRHSVRSAARWHRTMSGTDTAAPSILRRCRRDADREATSSLRRV